MLGRVRKTAMGRGRPTDWMCVTRYALYGALLGGAVADLLISPSAKSVYFGAVFGAVLLTGAKLLIVPNR